MTRRQARWSALLAAGAILTAAGYWGPWVAHKAAALVVPGLDLAEYVKFLPEYRNGQVDIWREGFYLPLLTLSLTLSFASWSLTVRWPTFVRVIAWLASVSAALAMLPPAWSPATLRLPEFRLQVLAIGLCLVAAAGAPVWRRYRATWAHWVLAVLSLLAIAIPIAQFGIIRPALNRVYGRPITPGWGPAVMALGLGLAAIALVRLARLPATGSDSSSS